MSRVYDQVPRHSFYWLLCAVLLAALPHLLASGVWLRVLLVAVLGYRWWIHIGRGHMLNKWWRTLLLLGALVGVSYEHGNIFGVEPSTQLLVAAFLLKTLEMYRLRDAYVLLILGYFVAATTFLFYQGPLAALYVLLVLWLLTAALVGINVPTRNWPAKHHGRISGLIMLLGLPVMLMLFVLVPRFGPLWAIPSPTGQAKTGMSATMRLGDISALSESTELAFRVEFFTTPPTQQELYWRGLILSEFDGRTWSVGQSELTYYPSQHVMPEWWRTLQQTRAEGYEYRVLLESTGETWLYALSHSITDTQHIGVSEAGILTARQPLYERFNYHVRSYPEAPILGSLNERDRARYLRLPPVTEPKTRALAQQLREQHYADAAFVAAALQWYTDAEFTYTHQPPTLGKHANDEFLFGERRGFCEHFASSFAFLMRAGGVPARVVVGYQGGEWNPRSQHLSVYQYQAHAWVEVWLANRGWMRVDPTATVAPHRVEQERTAAASSSSAARTLWYGNRWVNTLRKQLDWMEFSWQRWVLNYNEEAQSKWLRQWFGDVSPAKLGVFMLLFGAVLMLPVIIWALLADKKAPASPLQREFHWLRGIIAKRGGASLAESKHWSAQQLAEHGRTCWPGYDNHFKHWAEEMDAALYGGAEQEQTLLRLKRLKVHFKKLPRQRGNNAKSDAL